MSQGLIESLTNYFWPESGETSEPPADVCVNCWGHYEYDGEIRQAVKDKQVDVNNKKARHAFIQEFAVNHVSGIRLRNDAGVKQACPRCGRS